MERVVRVYDGFNTYWKMSNGKFTINTSSSYDLNWLLEREYKITAVTNENNVLFEIGGNIITDDGITTVDSFFIEEEKIKVKSAENKEYFLSEIQMGVSEEVEYHLSFFNKEVFRQLNLNAHKGNILEFDNLSEIFTELEYHKAKLMIAIRDNNVEAIQEYTADCSIYFFLLAYQFGALTPKKDTTQVFLKKNLFGKIDHNLKEIEVEEEPETGIRVSNFKDALKTN